MKNLLITTVRILCFLALWAALFYGGTRALELLTDGSGLVPAGFELCRQAIACAVAFLIICGAALVTNGRSGFPKLAKRPLRSALLGLFAGVFWVGVTFILFFVTDSVFADAREIPDYFFVWAAAVLVNVLTQELILRGYVYTVVSREYGAVSAIAVSSLVSLAVQGDAIANGAAAIIFTVCASALYGALRYYTKGLLAPVITHLIWDLAAGLVLGLVNLGQDYPVIISQSVVGEDIISGGRAGFEGSALAIIVCIALIDLIYLLINDRAADAKTAPDPGIDRQM